ncbi:Protein kinase domain [Dillenia turbinata]|uniref:Protein kinase domain n=1 Tax=Dillenia turbinata TaxID=194707 RepID=A0AAN8VBZ9_9MAGN
MSKLLGLSLLIFVLLSLATSISISADDKLTLLAFKVSVVDHANSLSSWSNSTDPCSGTWLGVTCNIQTKHVTRLLLQNLNLTGSIQTLVSLSHLRLLSLKHNHLSLSNLSFSSFPNLKHLYLSHNLFSGQFPAGISHLRRLRRLDLSDNFFSGEIPLNELFQLPNLLTLRLEKNAFAGSLSLSLSSSSPFRILDFNVSFNNLSGEIPASLSIFPASSFSHNRNLCGMPLQEICQQNSTAVIKPVPTRVSDSDRRKRNNSVILIIIIADAAAIMITIAFVTLACYFCKRRERVVREEEKEKERERKKRIGRGEVQGKKSEDEIMVFFDGCIGFTKVDDLLTASAEMLGKGSVGTTYKVVMEGGDAVVVKRVRQRRKRNGYDWFLREIGGLRHCNVVSLRAYYSSPDELLLVFDFLPNQSLWSLLHGNRGPGRTPVDWTTRLKIASDSAKGLAYLHSYRKTKLLHGHLTSSNIIVDQLGNACIADVGLYQILSFPSDSSNNAYKAPELLKDNTHQKYTHKCDVYSFGIILLEILTGKMPTGEGETSLVRWVRCVVKEHWTWEVFDFELLRYKDMEDEMIALMQVALLCLAQSSKDRPKMSVVHKMIEDIRKKGNGDDRIHSALNNELSSESSPSLSESTPNFTSSN